MKALATEVPLVDTPVTAPDRTVGLDEARREMSMWLEAGKEEVEALEVTAGAFERIESTQVDQWISEGKRVVQVP